MPGDAAKKWSTLTVDVDYDEDCPVCGYGASFIPPREYGVCKRCEWIDDPDAYATPAFAFDLNGNSIEEARKCWPERIVERLAAGPLSRIDIAQRAKGSGTFEFVVDGLPMPEIVPGAGALSAVLDYWPVARSNGASFADLLSPTPTGRLPIYVCPVCGDTQYEPMVTADLSVREDRVIWSRVGLERYQYFGNSESDQDGFYLSDRALLSDGFAFDAAQYNAVFEDFRKLFD